MKRLCFAVLHGDAARARRASTLGWCLAIGGAIACGGGGDSTGPNNPPTQNTATVKSVVLDFPTATLARGQTLNLQPTLKDSVGNTISNRALDWVSADPTVVQVTANGTTGSLAALKTGTTTVTGTVNAISATSTITVLAFTTIGPGSVFSCAIETTGKLFCAGTPYPTLAVPVAPQLRFTSVVSGGPPLATDAYACAIAIDQRAYCWGGNGSGQLGTGDHTARTEPTLVSGGLSFSQISVGWYHACGVTTTGEGYCWGEGSEGRLGTGDVNSRSTPALVQAPGSVHFTQIEAGNFATCGIAVTGQAYCWGRNDLGQLGSSQAIAGHIGDYSINPVPVDNAASTLQIVTSGPKSCLLNQAGKAFCFGNNSVKELGATSTETCYGEKPCSTTPLPVQTTQVFIKLAASQFATCGLTAAGQTWCWGMDNENLFGAAPGAVGNCPGAGALYGCTAAPVQGVSGLQTLFAQRANHCGRKDDGVIYCWGGNATGQRGWGIAAPDYSAHAFSISPGSVP